MIIDSYAWRDGREAMLRFGPAEGPVTIIALPLFEEANRTRTFAVTLCRALARLGIGSAIPDLPGQGESLVPSEDATILGMQEAYAIAAEQLTGDGRVCFGVGIRSGALLDALGLLAGRWHFAPQGGPDLLRELTRIKQAELGPAVRLGDAWYLDGSPPAEAVDPAVEIAGNRLSPDLLTELTVKQPFDQSGNPRRIVRLSSDQKPADRKVDAAPLWRRAEPGDDPALAALLAEDIAQWIASCGG